MPKVITIALLTASAAMLVGCATTVDSSRAVPAPTTHFTPAAQGTIPPTTTIAPPALPDITGMTIPQARSAMSSVLGYYHLYVNSVALTETDFSVTYTDSPQKILAYKLGGAGNVYLTLESKDAAEARANVEEIATGTLYDGTYEVGPDAAHKQIPAGRYQITEPVDGCYWERTSKTGDIIDNDFVTHAQTITVTIKASDGSFTSQECAPWQKIG